MNPRRDLLPRTTVDLQERFLEHTLPCFIILLSSEWGFDEGVGVEERHVPLEPQLAQQPFHLRRGKG